MATCKISESGRINENGQLLMPMDRINAWCKEHRGERAVIRIEASAPDSTASQQSYYYNYIVPTIQNAFHETGERKTEKAIDKFLVEQYPGDKQIFGFGVDATKGRELNKIQMADFIEWLKQYAAEPPLSVYIEDPKTL